MTFFYLPAAFSHTWPVLPWRARGRLGVLPRGTAEGTSPTPAAAGCGDTRCGWRALRRTAISSGGEAGVCFHLCGLDSTVLTALTELSPPLPSHPALAVGTRLVEVAGRARGLVHHG